MRARLRRQVSEVLLAATGLVRAHVVRTADDSALDTLVRLLSEYCLLDLLAATSYRCGT